MVSSITVRVRVHSKLLGGADISKSRRIDVAAASAGAMDSNNTLVLVSKGDRAL